MSVVDLKNYAKACAEDEALREKAKQIGIENVQQHIEHAKQLGYYWDENDLQEFSKQMQAEGELSEEDLENVAGGVGPVAPLASAVTSVVGPGNINPGPGIPGSPGSPGGGQY